MVSGEILAICNCARQLLVSTEMGVIYRVDWSGRFDAQMSVYLSKLTFANDLLPTSRGDGECVISLSWRYLLCLPAFFFANLVTLSGQSPEGLQCAVDICHCPELHGFVLVLSGGKVAFVTSKTAMFDPEVRLDGQ